MEDDIEEEVGVNGGRGWGSWAEVEVENDREGEEGVNGGS